MAKDIGKLVREQALKARTPLYRWMHSHYAELKPLLTEDRPPWEAVVRVAYEEGQVAKDGQPYPRQRAWKTWKQLQQDMEKGKPAEAPPPQPTKGPVIDVQPGSRPVGTFTFSGKPREDDKIRLFGRPKKSE